MVLLSLSVGVQLTHHINSTDFVQSLDLKSLYNANVGKLNVVITKLDGLIKEADDHQKLLETNVSNWKIKYLNKKTLHDASVLKKLNENHLASLAKSAESLAKTDMITTKTHYDTAKTLRLASEKGTNHTLFILRNVRSIIAKLLTGTHYPTKAPSLSPTGGPTTAPTKWVPPTPAPTNAPTNAPTKAPTKPPTKAPTNAPTSSPTASNVLYYSGSKPMIFNGTNRITIPSSTNIVTNELTMMVWVFVTKVSPDGNGVCLIGNARKYGIWVYNNDIVYSHVYCLTSGQSLYNYTSMKFPVNQWTHLAMSWKKDGFHKMYKGGVLTGENMTSGTPCAGSGPITLGKGSIYGGLIGKLKDARVYTKVLSQSEIFAIKGQP